MRNKKIDVYMYVLGILTALILILLAIMLGGKIYNPNTFSGMMLQISEFGVIAAGMALVILIGGIDLSIVANANLSGIVASLILAGGLTGGSPTNEFGILIAVITALFISMICGFINGVLVAKLSVVPIVATISTMTLYSGISLAITSGKTITGFPEAFVSFGETKFLDIPILFIIMVTIIALTALFLRRTVLGRKIYLLGENHTASRFTGINNERIIIFVYTLTGLLAGIAGIIMINRASSAKVGFGDTYLLQAILVTIMGGFSLSGGKGKMFGIALALCCIQFLSTAFTVWKLSPFTNKLIWGVMLLILMFASNVLTDVIERHRIKNIKISN